MKVKYKVIAHPVDPINKWDDGTEWSGSFMMIIDPAQIPFYVKQLTIDPDIRTFEIMRICEPRTKT